MRHRLPEGLYGKKLLGAGLESKRGDSAKNGIYMCILSNGSCTTCLVFTRKCREICHSFDAVEFSIFSQVFLLVEPITRSRNGSRTRSGSGLIIGSKRVGPWCSLSL